MISVIHHALLGIAVCALSGTALRLASRCGARGLDRVLAALALGAALAVAEALLLGLVGLGTSPIALVIAAAATWAVAAAGLPAPSPRPLQELRSWWGALGAPARAAVGASAGALAVYAAWLLRYPSIGTDGLTYHLPAIAGWVQNGSPGTATDYFDDLPTGSYPITNEVLLSWAVGLSRSLVAITLWSVGALAMLCLAGWQGLRALDVPRGVAALAVAALASTPLAITQASGLYTDLPAVAWLVVAGALCAAARARPALLAPAIVAAGLAIGTKATPLVPALLVLAAAALATRGSLRRLARPLTVAVAAALLVGGTWFVRNLVEHGSPLWPLIATPFGDPVPPVLRQIDGRLISDPGSIPARAEEYAMVLGGSILLLAGALLAPLVARRRAVVLTGGAAALCLLLWVAAPYTLYPRGEQFDSLAVGATRYLLPAIATACLALALAASGGPRRAVAGQLLLLGACVWNVVRDIAFGFPFLPSAALLAGGAAAGALAIAAASSVARPPATRALVAATVLAAAALAWPASGYVSRHLRVERFALDHARFIAASPRFSEGDRPIAYAGGVNGALVGDHLRHPVRLLPRSESCASLRDRVATEWVVLPKELPAATIEAPPASRLRLAALTRCLAGLAPAYEDGLVRVYGDHR